METKTKSQLFTLAICACILTASMVVPTTGVLNRQMICALCLMAVTVVLWIKRPIPLAPASLAVIVLQPLLGLQPSLRDAFQCFTNPSTYFVIASFGVALALRKTSVPERLFVKLLRVCGGSSKRITLAFMLLTYLISTIMSDMIAVMIGIGFVLELLPIQQDEKERKQLGRLLMLSIPIASSLGGTATSVGSSLNILALALLKEHTGLEISFLQWLIAGLPLSFAVMIVSWLIITWLIRAKDLPQDKVDSYSEKIRNSKKTISNEKAILAVLAAMIFAWIFSSWFPKLDTTTVAVFGLAALFFPGIRAFTWDEFKQTVAWEIPFMGGAMISLGTVVKQTGLMNLMVDGAISVFPTMSAGGMVAFVATFITVMLMLLPVGPAAISILTAPACLMALAYGVNPIIIVIAIATFASNCTILPLNAIFMVSYTKGYWTAGDLARTGLLLSVVWVGLAALWLPLVSVFML